MEYAQKILWTEGMFLTPHHFQQADRYYEHLITRRLSALNSMGWGILQLQVAQDALANGEFVVSRCVAMMPDGVAVDSPTMDSPPPSRPIEGAFDAKRSSLGVYLGVPLTRAGGLAATLQPKSDGPLARYYRRSITVNDENTASNEREVSVAAKSLRILFEGEPMEDYEKIKIAELTRPGGKFALNEAFVPPCLYMSASAGLTTILRRILEIISAKSTELSAGRRQRATGLVEFTMSEAANFWFLHTVNAYIPALMHFHNRPDVHPERVYLILAQLAGELFTFAGDGHPKDLPTYTHENPGESFAAIEKRISDLMGTVIPTRCTPIPLERTRESLFTGKLRDDRIVEAAQLYLAVMAEVPEEKIIKEIPLKAKISSQDKVDQLIAAALRGLPLRHLPTPPAEIPVQPGRQYFSLDKAGDHWEAVKKSRSISFYVPPEFKGLKLEFMAVKE